MSETKNGVPVLQAGRRRLLKAGAVGAGAGLIGTGLNDAAAKDDVRAPYTTPFVVALPVYPPKAPERRLNPAPTSSANINKGECGRDAHQHWADFTARKFYQLRVKEANHSFHPELPTQKIWGYDGLMPGPTFLARYGEPAIVRIFNELPLNSVGFGSPEISTHLHNLHVGSESDGYTGNYYSKTKYGPTLSAPGRFQDHLYPNCYAGYDDPRYHATNGDPREAVGTLWYHDHRIDFTGPNVYKGLAGFYLLFDEIDSGNEKDFNNSKALRLPSGVGVYDIPLIFQDLKFDSGGYLAFDQFETDGILGDKFCVNGKVQPYFKVARRKYRFRLLDGGPSRFYEFYLVHQGADQPFTYIANDGNLLPAPLTMSKVRLGPAERADIVIDFSQYPIGSQLYIVNRLEQTSGRGPSGIILNPGTQVLRFDVDRDPPEPDVSRVPPMLRELPPITLSEVVRTRKWEFDREAGGWTVNSKLFDVSKPAASVKRGTAEIWVLEGKGSWTHPVHIHLEEGRILTRNGVAPPPHEQGRKDVFDVGPGEVVRVFIRFRDYLGKYMMHCHNLTHEDHAMMVRIDIVP